MISSNLGSSVLGQSRLFARAAPAPCDRADRRVSHPRGTPHKPQALPAALPAATSAAGDAPQTDARARGRAVVALRSGGAYSHLGVWRNTS